MALNKNYGFPPSGYSSPYSSTPTGIRAQRPRFGYSGPSMYPRSRMSASDTESFSDSMVNNYGTSTSRFDSTFNSGNRSSFNDSYNSSGSNYYSANNTFSQGQSYGETSMHSDYSLRENESLSRDNSMMYEGQNRMCGGYSGIRALPHSDSSNSGIRPFPQSDTLTSGIRAFPQSDTLTSGIRALPRSASDTSNSGFLSKGISQLNASKYNYNTTFGMNNAAEFKGTFQKKPNIGDSNKKPYFTRKPLKMAEKKPLAWRCQICDIDFTSHIPYDMHFRGAKHAKKIRSNMALQSVLKAEKEANTVTSREEKKLFFCELCNVKANSSLQLQMHLEGVKHKSKLQPKETPESETPECSKDSENTSVIGKTNGSLVRPLPSDFGEPQPSKLTKYACEVCNLAVNSEVQLQQHLMSKKHQNKVEGKPVTKGRKVRKDTDTTPVTEKAEETPVEQVSNETSTKVVGIKTLASSFVQGETSVEQASNETSTTIVGAETSTKVVGAETSTKVAGVETSTKVVGVKTLASSFVQGETLQ